MIFSEQLVQGKNLKKVEKTFAPCQKKIRKSGSVSKQV